jgi:hypothetical protein
MAYTVRFKSGKTAEFQTREKAQDIVIRFKGAKLIPSQPAPAAKPAQPVTPKPVEVKPE